MNYYIYTVIHLIHILHNNVIIHMLKYVCVFDIKLILQFYLIKRICAPRPMMW
jgi:hypothetical protein